MLYIPFEEVREELCRVLRARGCPQAHAWKVAHEMARNSLEGVYTHGVNRFGKLVRNIDQGLVRLDVEPVETVGFGALQGMDGQLGLGVVNAWLCMERAIALAREHGVGLVALRNTNHWMRAATYGYQACEAGMAALCFTNTQPNMPAWGATDARLGNNPLTMAIPCAEAHVVLDMATSQFSYGALELAKLENRQMPVDAGFDEDGRLTRDPQAVLRSQRILPMGYWKGAGLSLLLDLFAGCLSLGNTVFGIGRLAGDEHGVSQVFMAIDYHKIAPAEQSDAILRDALDDLRQSRTDGSTGGIRWPGYRMPAIRAKNLQNGIPVDERVWENIRALG